MLLLMDANGRLRVRVVFGATLVACAAAVLAPTEPDSNTRKCWSHVPVLADDKMRGRDTGSAGYRRAAEYVASQFARARLTPIGEHGYFPGGPAARPDISGGSVIGCHRRLKGEGQEYPVASPADGVP